MRLDRLKSRNAFHDFKAIGRHQKRLGRCVVAVVRPSDPLHQTFDVLWRTDLDHEIHIAPVDAQIKASCADNRPQIAPHHRRFDLFALLPVKRSVMDADGQGVLVGEPEVVKENLGLCAGVVKDQRGLVLFHLFQNRRDAVFCTAP